MNTPSWVKHAKHYEMSDYFGLGMEMIELRAAGEHVLADAKLKARERIVNRCSQRARWEAKRNGRKPRAYNQGE